MPILSLRSIGVSYALEGIAAAGLDGETLHDALQDRYGEAVAAIGTPAETVLIDRKAETWNGLMAWTEAWVRSRGYPHAHWTGPGAADPRSGPATLHFHT